VDKVVGVIAHSDEAMTEPERIHSGLDYVAGVVKLEDGLVFIHDLDTFLSVEEEKTLDQAMSA
jgi:purine-binding chemotaxis protein CheW